MSSLKFRARTFVAGLSLVALLVPAARSENAPLRAVDVFPEGWSVCAGHAPIAAHAPDERGLGTPVPHLLLEDEPDLKSLRWINVPVAGVSETFEFDVQADAVGLVLHAATPRASECVISVELFDPDGRMLSCANCSQSGAASSALEGVGVTQLPSTTNLYSELRPGRYSFRVRATSTNAQECEDLDVNVTAQFRTNAGVQVEHRLDLNFVYLPNSTLSADIAQNSALFDRFLVSIDKSLKATGIRIGEVTHVDLDRPEFEVIATWEEVGRMMRTSTEVGRTRALNVYCVRTFEAPLNPVVGLSGGIPGPGWNGGRDSGIALKMEPFFQCADCLNAYASLMAHEIGHYLGFYHTSEANLQSWDPLDDTPNCDEPDLRICPDWSYVMFPVIHPANNIWSPAQRAIAKTHPIVRTVAIIGNRPTDHEMPGEPGRVTVGPSPFADVTTVQARGAGGALDVEVLDVAGRRVTSLRGTTEVQWDGRGGDGRDVPAGVYFLRVRVDGETETRRVVKTR